MSANMQQDWKHWRLRREDTGLAWLELDKAGFKGTVKTTPSREDITMPIQEQLIVELYSK